MAASDLAMGIFAKATKIIQAKSCFHHNGKFLLDKIECMIGWNFPQSAWFKLSVDGFITKHEPKANCGGLIGNDVGAYIGSFSCNLGICSIMKVEFWGLLKDIHLACEEGIRKLEVKTNSNVFI